MTTNISDVQDEQRRAEPDLSALAEQLVATARTQGVELTGPRGLLTGLTRQVLETALETELGEHLGHERGERSGSGNVRNGSSAKTVRTDVGEVRINVPRDRAGTFSPMVVPKHAFLRDDDRASATPILLCSRHLLRSTRRLTQTIHGTGSEEVHVACGLDGAFPVDDTELVVDRLAMGLDSIERHVELRRDVAL